MKQKTPGKRSAEPSPQPVSPPARETPDAKLRRRGEGVTIQPSRSGLGPDVRFR